MAERHKKPRPTPAELHELFDFDPKSGKLWWKRRPQSMFSHCLVPERDCSRWNNIWAGKPALTGVDGHGYNQGSIWGRYVKAHQVMWALFYGYWPTEIDHDDGDRQNNRISNLKDVSHAENHKNCRRSKRNTSGITGVSWDKVHGKWQAHIRHDGRSRNLGAFLKFEDAVAARKQAEREAGFSDGHGTERTSPNHYIPVKDR